MDTDEARVLNRIVREYLKDGDQHPIGIFTPDFFADDKESLLSTLFQPVEHRVLWLSANKYYDNASLDSIDEKYLGKSVEDMELVRQRYIAELKKIDDDISRVEEALKYAQEINEWEVMYHFLQSMKVPLRTAVSMDVCCNIFKCGMNLSLTDIKTILPWLEKSDIYGYSIMLNMPIQLTDQEKDEIRKEYMDTGTPKVLEKIFGTAIKRNEE